MTTSVASVRVADQAEDLIRTLPGVLSVRVIDDAGGAIQEVHLLTTSEISAKQTVRNVESALLAHLGIRIDHRRISVAATTESPLPPRPAPDAAPLPSFPSSEVADDADNSEQVHMSPDRPAAEGPKRRIYFEDVEVRGSRARGLACRVTLTKSGTSFIGEARGVDGDRARLELAARATCLAISDADGRDRQFGLEGVRIFDAFDRKFVFVGIIVRCGRESRLLAGSCEVVDSAETAAALAVLDATNRWIEYGA